MTNRSSLRTDYTKWLSAFVLALMLLMAFHPAEAQVLTGTLTGTISDPTDAVVPNVTVTATDTGSGRVYTEKTNSSGVYTFTNLPNSNYKISASAGGFAKTEVENIRVDVSQTARINVKLELAKTGSEVVVQAEQTAVQSDSAELKNTVDSAQLNAIPLPTAAILSDLVKTFRVASHDPERYWSRHGARRGDAFVHGLRGNDTNLTHGTESTCRTVFVVKTSAFFALSSPVADTIEEINVSVGGIGTDGGFGAAQVSMVTKKGTRSIITERVLTGYQRTSFLNATTPGSITMPASPSPSSCRITSE